MLTTLRSIYHFFAPIFRKVRKYFFIYTGLFLLARIGFVTLLPLTYQQIIDEANTQFTTEIFSLQGFRTAFIFLILVLLISVIARRIGDRFETRFNAMFPAEIHSLVFSIISQQDYHFFTNNLVGSITNKAARLGRNVLNLIRGIVFDIIFLLAELVVMLIIIFSQNSTLGFIFLVFSCSFIIFSSLFFKKQAQLDKDRAAKFSYRSGILSDLVTNILNVKIFGDYSNEEKFYNKAVADVKNAILRVGFYSDTIQIYKSIFFVSFELVIIGVSIFLLVQQDITIGLFLIVLVYERSFTQNNRQLSSALLRIIENISVTQDAIEILTEPTQVNDPEHPETFTGKDGRVTLQHISFSYPEGADVFSNFSLDIPPGQSVGLVGRSGSGKTTVTKLLLRLYDLNEGAIMFDRQDIRTVRQSDVRSHITYVPQESILFHRSIYENIAYGNQEASREEVMAAAHAAHVHEFVQYLPDGYETKVGERGVKLSGGQRQRIAIARAFLKKSAPILIMDEATSSLDSESEHFIQDSFIHLMENRTTIVIAHRLSTIQRLDRIIVLDKGKIIEDGSHVELMSNNGLYADLWNSQVGGMIRD